MDSVDNNLYTGINPLKVLEQPISPAVLASILGINVSYIYQEVQKGRIPDLKESNYLDVIRFQLKYYKSQTEAKIQKQELDHAKDLERLRLRHEAKNTKFTISEDDLNGKGLSIQGLTAGKLKQDIRLGFAKEAETWLKVLASRGKCIFIENLIPYIEPFMMSIRNGLLKIQRNHPELQEEIDELMKELYGMGKEFASQVGETETYFLEKVKNTEFSMDDGIEDIF